MVVLSKGQYFIIIKVYSIMITAHYQKINPCDKEICLMTTSGCSKYTWNQKADLFNNKSKQKGVERKPFTKDFSKS